MNASLLRLGLGLTLVSVLAACTANQRPATPVKPLHAHTTPWDVTAATLEKAGFLERYLRDVAPAVVCIRNESVYETVTHSTLDRDLTVLRMRGHSKGHGTGVVFADERVGGRTEYLLFTNVHVANGDPVTSGGVLVDERLSLVDNKRDDDSSNDIHLERIASFPDTDYAILRTVGAPPDSLHVMDATVGTIPDEGGKMFLISTANPHGEMRRTEFGWADVERMVEVNLLPYPSEVISAKFPQFPGESGGVMFAVYGQPGEEKLHFVGLIYGGDYGSDVYITPAGHGVRLFSERRNIPSQRPSLDERFTEERLASVVDPEKSYDFFHMNMKVGETEEGYYLRHGRESGDEYLDVMFRLNGGGIEITGLRNPHNAKRLAPDALAEVQREYTGLTTSLLNHLLHHELEYPEAFEGYRSRLIYEERNMLGANTWSFYSVMHRSGIVNDEFMWGD